MYGPKRGQPWELEDLSGQTQTPAPRGPGNDAARDGFERLSSTSNYTKRRNPVGGTPVYRSPFGTGED